MIKIQNILILLLSTTLFSVVGCSTTAAPKTQTENFALLQDKQTTDKEVRIVFGTPDASFTKNKTKTWVYRNKDDSKEKTYRLPEAFHVRGMILVFNAAGVLQEHRQVDIEQLKTTEKPTTDEADLAVTVRTEDPPPKPASISKSE